MCDATGLMLASLAISGAQGIAQYQAANAQADAQEDYNAQLQKNAEQAYVNDLAALQLQQRQDEKQAKQKIAQNQKQAIQARSRAKTAAGEAGVSGLSVDALLGDFERQEAEFKDSVRENLGNRNQQRHQEALAAGTRLQSRQNSVQPVSRPSLIGTGLQIAGSAVGTLSDYDRYKNPPRS